ncbi:MAG: peptide deformylase [Candidatus Paceibacteria bacterium]|jgi:peptide deformylase
MAKLVPENHPALHAIAEECTAEDFADGTVSKIIKDLRQAIKTYDVDGYAAVAIAAPQIGISKRVFIVEDQSEDREGALPTIIAVNPRFLKMSKKMQEGGEGCLSIPDTYGIVRRHKNVTIEATDENGNLYTRGAGGLLATIMQHEYDHLDGILFPDRAEKTWKKGNEPEEYRED